MKSAKWSKIPTPDEIAAFDGRHCSSQYRKALRLNWRCPSCNRSAHELIRWTYINGATMRRLHGDEHGMGWSIALVTHHSHGARSFPQALLCGECNSADGTIKRKLKLPADWSFSPAELGQIVSATPHSGKTVIDYELAKMIYDEMTGALV